MSSSRNEDEAGNEKQIAETNSPWWFRNTALVAAVVHPTAASTFNFNLPVDGNSQWTTLCLRVLNGENCLPTRWGIVCENLCPCIVAHQVYIWLRTRSNILLYEKLYGWGDSSIWEDIIHKSDTCIFFPNDPCYQWWYHFPQLTEYRMFWRSSPSSQ